MKDSGIEWIGQIPEEWLIKRIGSLYSERRVKVSDKDYPPLSVTKKGILPQLETVAKTDAHDDRKLVVNGDFVINSRSDRRGSCGISDLDGSVSLINTVLTPKIKLDRGYYRWLFSSALFADEFYKWGHGIVDDLWTTNWNDMKSIVISYPPKEIQHSIATYLDRKCSEIDSIVRETEQTIEEYKKLKQSLITEVVTGKKRVADDGLSLSNEPRKMKDSGVEWIGEVPEEWNLCPFRHLLKERSEKNNPIKSEERLSLSIELGVTLYSEKTTNLDRFKDDFTQYKLAHEGDLVMNSMNMIVGASGVSKYFGCVSPVYYTYYDELEDHVTTKFCEYIFRCKTMLRVLYSLGKGIYAIERGDDKVNTCRLKVSKEDLKSIMIPCPSENEQRIIVKYLSTKCSEIDKLIADKQTLLQELDTYKKSLIYECVTGKREVN